MKKLRRRKSGAAFATWSLNGKLREKRRQEESFTDMASERVGFAALQETTWSQDAIARGSDGEKIISLHPQDA